MEGRLKRQQINSTSIPASVDTLLDPEVPLALRLSGQLLLGVVRIYARKVSLFQPLRAGLQKVELHECLRGACMRKRSSSNSSSRVATATSSLGRMVRATAVAPYSTSLQGPTPAASFQQPAAVDQAVGCM